jgi:biopolymer transport protein ExbB
MTVTDVNTSMGFAHFIAQSDFVGKSLLAILVAMSAISWTLIVVKGLGQLLRTRRSEKFLNFFWNARSLDEVSARSEITTHGVEEPFAHLTAHAMNAQAHHAKYGAAKLEEAGSAQDFVTRTIKKVLDEETTRLENGLAVLATVGATAPFVGLFGTVWGIMTSFQAIAVSKNTNLAVVAPGIAEALFATALGLMAAIPAVVFYNKFQADSAHISQRLEAFADEFAAIVSRQIDVRS